MRNADLENNCWRWKFWLWNRLEKNNKKNTLSLLPLLWSEREWLFGKWNYSCKEGTSLAPQLIQRLTESKGDMIKRHATEQLSEMWKMCGLLHEAKQRSSKRDKMFSQGRKYPEIIYKMPAVIMIIFYSVKIFTILVKILHKF